MCYPKDTKWWLDQWRQIAVIICDNKSGFFETEKYKIVALPVAVYGAPFGLVLKTHGDKDVRWTLGLTRLDHVSN